MAKHKTGEIIKVIKELENHPDFQIVKTKMGFKITHIKTAKMYHCHTDVKAFHPLRRFVINGCETELTVF